MKRSTIFLLIAVVILVGAVVAWISIDKAAKKKAAAANANAGSQPGNDTSAAPAANNLGNTSSNSIANNLTSNYAPGYPITYNKLSAEAKALQWYLGVTQDGLIGPKTLSEWQKYKQVTSSFKINNRKELDYYGYEIQEKRAGRTPKSYAQYFAVPTKNVAQSVGGNILTPVKIALQGQSDFWTSIFG